MRMMMMMMVVAVVVVVAGAVVTMMMVRAGLMGLFWRLPGVINCKALANTSGQDQGIYRKTSSRRIKRDKEWRSQHRLQHSCS